MLYMNSLDGVSGLSAFVRPRFQTLVTLPIASKAASPSILPLTSVLRVTDPQYGLDSTLDSQLNGAGSRVVTLVTGPPTAGVYVVVVTFPLTSVMVFARPVVS